MKKKLFFLCIIVFLGCKSKKDNNEPQQVHTPEALQDNNEIKLTSLYKRAPDDLVDELYNEKLENTPDLKALENSYNSLDKKKNDSLSVFEEFDSKNKKYYSSVNGHLNYIHDSLLKSELNTVFENNRHAYDNTMAVVNDLEERLGKQSVSVMDRQVALKLFVTLNMMNDFRKNKTPATEMLESVLNGFKILSRKLDSAINKNK